MASRPPHQPPTPPKPGTAVPPTPTAPLKGPPPAAPGAPPNGRGVSPLATGSCPANIQETKIAFGFIPQVDVATENALPEIWSLTKTNPALSVVNPVNETDAADIGKSNEFPTQVFPSHRDATVAVEKFVSSEIMAWLFCFTTGKATKTSAGTGFTYSAIPSDPVVNCINLPTFTYAEQIRAEPDSVVDRALVGCVVGEWTLTMSSGPGRANCRVTMTWPGSGRVNSPSGLSPLPFTTTEHFLNASGAKITINGIDYLITNSFISLEFHWNNNVRLDQGLYPGSGTQNGYAVRGRMEHGIREMTLSFRARAQKGSPEYNNLINQTEGPASFGVDGATINGGPNMHNFLITMPRTRMSAVTNGEDNGIVTVDCQAMALQPTDGVTPIITMEATTLQDGILGL